MNIRSVLTSLLLITIPFLLFVWMFTADQKQNEIIALENTIKTNCLPTKKLYKGSVK